MKPWDGWKITRNGGKLLIDVYLSSYRQTDKKYRTTEEIVYDDTAKIISKGYRECIGFKNEIAYYKMPVYIKFHNFKKCDYRNGFTDDLGRVIPEDTPGAYP